MEPSGIYAISRAGNKLISQYCNDSFYFEIDLKRHNHRKHEKKILCTMCDNRSWNES